MGIKIGFSTTDSGRYVLIDQLLFNCSGQRAQVERFSNGLSVWLLFVCPYLLVAGNSAINCSIHNPIQTHAKQVDVAVVMAVLILADESAKLLVLVLYHIYGIL